MLIGFSVSNYKSFNESQSFSLVASKISRHKEHIAVINNRKILKSGLIFGANASGKSNFIKAIYFSRQVVLKGLDSVNTRKRYFRIDNNMYDVPGVFEYRIMVNETEYSYGLTISYKNNEIVGEWLNRLEPNGSEVTVFNRKVNEMGISNVTSDIQYDTPEENVRMDIYLSDFGENLSDAFRKKTILGDIALRISEKSGMFPDIKDVYEWFKSLTIVFPSSRYNALNDIVVDEDMRNHYNRMMTFFDTGIESIEGQQQEMDFDKVFQDMPREDAEKLKLKISNETLEHPIMIQIDNKIYVLRRNEDGNIVYHKLLLNHGNSDELFEYFDESDGTRRLLDLVPLFYEKAKSRVILIDEIDRSLHTNLTKEFIQKFYEYFVGVSCQLIATTHDSNLLDLELLRQDEIWFIEREADHSSKIYSLNKFKERFDKKIDKEYLIGRYGAVPVFKEEELRWERNYDQ